MNILANSKRLPKKEFCKKIKAKKKQKTEINKDNFGKALQDKVQFDIKSIKLGDLLEKIRTICQTIWSTSIGCKRANLDQNQLMKHNVSETLKLSLNGFCFLKSYFY